MADGLNLDAERAAYLAAFPDVHFKGAWTARNEQDFAVWLKARATPPAPSTAPSDELSHGHRDDWHLMANARRLTENPIRAVRNMTNRAFAAELFATGSGSASEICRVAGIDPDSCVVERANKKGPA